MRTNTVDDEQGRDDEIISFHSSSSSEPQRNMNCWWSFRNQWKLSLFALRDPSGKVIDLKATFAPSPRRIFGVLKVGLLGWTISVLAMDTNLSKSPFWFIYLTSWGQMITLICNAMNVFMFFYMCREGRYLRSYDVDQTSAGWIVIIPWIVSIVTINVDILIAILYWTLVHDGYRVTYLGVMVHGVLALLTTIDVLVINRTPVRLKQMVFVMLFECIYMTWSLIHFALDVGRPYSDNDPSTDDDSIYSALNWRKRPVSGAVTSIMIVFVVTPILYLFLWFISLLLKPHYCEDNEDEIVLNDNGGGEYDRDKIDDSSSNQI